jgi:hypothetical protein
MLFRMNTGKGTLSKRTSMKGSLRIEYTMEGCSMKRPKSLISSRISSIPRIGFRVCMGKSPNYKSGRSISNPQIISPSSSRPVGLIDLLG